MYRLFKTLQEFLNVGWGGGGGMASYCKRNIEKNLILSNVGGGLPNSTIVISAHAFV